MQNFIDSLQPDALGKNGLDTISKLFPALTEQILRGLSDDSVTRSLLEYRRRLEAGNLMQMNAPTLEAFKQQCRSDKRMAGGMDCLEKMLDPIDDGVLSTLSSESVLHLARKYKEFASHTTDSEPDADGHTPMHTPMRDMNRTNIDVPASSEKHPTPPTEKLPIEPDRWSKVYQRRRYSNVGGWSIGWYVVTYADMAITSGPELISSLLYQLPKGELVEAVEVLELGSRVRAYVHVRSKGDYHNARGWVSLAGNVGSKQNAFTWARKVEAPKQKTTAAPKSSAKAAWSGAAEPVERKKPQADTSASVPAVAGALYAKSGSGALLSDSDLTAAAGQLTTSLQAKLAKVNACDPALASLIDPFKDNEAFGAAMTSALGPTSFVNFRELGNFTGLGLLPGLPGFSIDVIGSLHQLLGDADPQTPFMLGTSPVVLTESE
jgi:hypothetical protein